MAKFILSFLLLTFICSLFASLSALSIDSQPMWDIVKGFTSPELPSSWELGTDPCDQWLDVGCHNDRVTHLVFSDFKLSGILHPSVSKLSALQYLDISENPLSGPLPSFANLTFLETIIFDNTSFSSIPSDFFSGLTHLQEVSINNIPLKPWTIPHSLSASRNLTIFSASNTSITGTIPKFVGLLSGLVNLTLSKNNLSGHIDVINTLPQLVRVELQENHFMGPIPDLSILKFLQSFNVSNNNLTGIIPQSLLSRDTLQNVSLSNNKLQGQFPVFSARNVTVDKGGENRFCKPTPGPCDPRVVALLEVAAALDYPLELANSWMGNDPCSIDKWLGITCDIKAGNITMLDFSRRNFSGMISPHLADLTSLKSIILNNNKLRGSIPEILTTLPLLQLLDVTNNSLSGKVPKFRKSVMLKLSGNHFDP